MHCKKKKKNPMQYGKYHGSRNARNANSNSPTNLMPIPIPIHPNLTYTLINLTVGDTSLLYKHIPLDITF